MAAWMIAAKALKASGVKIKGDILLAAVVGEIGHEPVDEFTGLDFIGKDFGTRYLLTHGGTADLAIVAEASNFSPGWVEAGKAFFKITVLAGPSRYTTYVEHVKPEESTNAIVKTSALIPILENWAKEYEEKNTTTFEGGTVVPKASIAAIRGGLPYLVIRPPELCSIYLDVRLVPGANPLDIREEILDVMTKNGFEGNVEIYMHRPGLESKGVEKILPSLGKAHKLVSGEEMVFPPAATVTSMWRDTNPYIEFGIPALTYGPGKGGGSGANSLKISELMKAARIYALVAYYIGQLERSVKE
jgi:acetylornithine deacetylase/succinyl-diaminopimelate desuccinylase-like protein